jgi:prepilin-type processing-associated H-X9-DG protein
VELLVVIGIIGVLIAILLPTLRAARRQSDMVKCASNLRQIASGALLRAQDSKGYMPLAGELILPVESNRHGLKIPEAVGDPFKTRYLYARAPQAGADMPVPFPAGIAQYLGYKLQNWNNWDRLDQELNGKDHIWKMFMCPASGAFDKPKLNGNPNDSTPVGQGTMMALRVYDSSSKPIAAWSTNSDYAINEGVFGFTWWPNQKHARLAGNINKVRNAASTVLFTDAKPRQGRAYDFMPDGWITWTPTNLPRGGVPLANALKVVNENIAREKSSFDLVRHNKRMNIVFADGHVSSYMIEDRALTDVYLIAPR